MCGIFGSKDKKTFLELYNLNRERGDFSYGGYYLNSDGSILCRSRKGPVNISDLPDADYYLGHTRAPTSIQSDFNVWECHPFTSFKYVYAHNGIINTIDLEKKYARSLPVDSMWLSLAISDKIDTKFIQEEIKGTYAVWSVDVTSNNISLFRCANPIYWNPNNQSFSSIKESLDYILLQEGKVYTFTPSAEGSDIKVTDTFKYNSPYFIPGE